MGRRRGGRSGDLAQPGRPRRQRSSPDKKSGTHVYGLDGKSRAFDPAAQITCIGELAAAACGGASDATISRQRGWLYGSHPAHDPYGRCRRRAVWLCLWQAEEAISLLRVEGGRRAQVRLDIGGRRPPPESLRSIKIQTQTEGEWSIPAPDAIGVKRWRYLRFDARASAPSAGALVAGSRELVASVEG